MSTSHVHAWVALAQWIIAVGGEVNRVVASSDADIPGGSWCAS